MIDVSILKALAAAGATQEMLIAAVEAANALEEEKAVARRLKATNKKRRQRGMSPLVPGTEGDTGGQTGTPFPPKERSPTPPKEITPIPEHAVTRTRARRLADDWKANEIERAYAVKQGIPEAEIAGTEEDFRNYWLGTGKPMASWTMTWQRWCREAVKRKRAPPNGTNGYSKPLSNSEKFINAIKDKYAANGDDTDPFAFFGRRDRADPP
jgi:hypothetical protein